MSILKIINDIRNNTNIPDKAQLVGVHVYICTPSQTA